MVMTKWVRRALLAASGAALLMLPGTRRLPRYHSTTLNGIQAIDDAVTHCRQTELTGCDLVAYAQQLVSQKFAVYTTLNLWDTPNHAFAVGMGYCTQYNLALKRLLDHLGFSSQAVFSLRVQVDSNPEWVMGHTWLRVTINGKTRDVCAGELDNRPGKVFFRPISPVLPGYPSILFLTHLGMIFFMGVLEWRTLLTGRPSPDWTYRRRFPETG